MQLKQLPDISWLRICIYLLQLNELVSYWYCFSLYHKVTCGKLNLDCEPNTCDCSLKHVILLAERPQ